MWASAIHTRANPWYSTAPGAVLARGVAERADAERGCELRDERDDFLVPEAMPLRYAQAGRNPRNYAGVLALGAKPDGRVTGDFSTDEGCASEQHLTRGSVDGLLAEVGERVPSAGAREVHRLTGTLVPGELFISLQLAAQLERGAVQLEG